MTTRFIYKPDSNTWFWMISAVFMGIGLCYIAVLSLNSSNAIWKLVLALSPFVFLFWTCARVVQYRFEYARTEADKIVELDHEIPKLTIKKNGEKYQILRTDIKQVNIFESYGDSPPFTDFTYLEIVLKSGKRFIIANRTATRQDLSVMLKGKKKVLKKRFMNRIKTTANKLPPEKTA